MLRKSIPFLNNIDLRDSFSLSLSSPSLPHPPSGFSAASCASSVALDVPAACTPIVGSMTAWRIVVVVDDGAAVAVGTDEQFLQDAVRDYVENERDSYADVDGLLRVEYVGPRGGMIIDAPPSDVVVAAAQNAGEGASGPPVVALAASLAAIASLLVVVAVMYAARRRRGGRRRGGDGAASREGADGSVGCIGSGAPEKAVPRLIDDDDDRTMPAAMTMSLSTSHSIDLPPDARLLPPAHARSDDDDDESVDVEGGGGWDHVTLGQSVASAGGTESEPVPGEDAAPPSPPVGPPILARADERPPAATATGADDSRGPSFEEDNDDDNDDDDVAPMSPMSSRAAGDDDDRSRTRSTGSSDEGDISELEISPSLYTRDDSLSFDDSVVPENDRNRMRDGEAARPVSAAWL